MARRRVLALAGLTALGCLLSTGSTAAQTGPTPIDPAKALQAALSTGKVTGAHGEAAGWVLARNIVVTTSVAAPQLGDSAQFLAFGAAAPASCRIAASDSTVGVAVLRCVGVTAPPLRRATDDLTEGDPARCRVARARRRSCRSSTPPSRSSASRRQPGIGSC
ncbi:MAG: hypothetical protein V9E99_05390 [Microthrixaceae bacterium]